MEIKDEDFLKEQKREEIKVKLQEMGGTTREIHIEKPKIEERPIKEEQKPEFNNILLNDEEFEDKKETKKKWLKMAIALIVLFLLTIILLRLFSGDKKDSTFNSEQTNTLESNNVEQAPSIDEKFQKVIDERLNNSQNTQEVVKAEKTQENTQDTQTTDSSTISEQKLDETIKKIEEKTKAISDEEEKEIQNATQKKEEVIVRKPVQKTVPKTTTKKVIKKKVEVKKIEKKQVEKKSVKDLMENTKLNNSATVSKNIKGYFIQVGAFKNMPSAKYIHKIKSAHKINKGGTIYHKVLIGPYSSKEDAKANISDIKNKLGISGAYVLKF
ncbi:MAG: hypothetical protein CSA86_05985 [Arcobacter sp.]|nr:MAG: hypothetical protein CSA86_05985 [Arcobacter sp.]